MNPSHGCENNSPTQAVTSDALVGERESETQKEKEELVNEQDTFEGNRICPSALITAWSMPPSCKGDDR
jgi:hypothetical protein